MRRSFAIIASLFIAVGSGTALAQPTSATKASAAAPSAAPSALPAGHPAMDPSLPAGHPPLDDVPDDDDDDDPPMPDPRSQNPHGQNPHGENPHGGSGREDLFEAPPDTAEDDATLPPGTIVIALRDARGGLVAHAPITVGVLHSSVARGDSHETITRETDDQGGARLDGLGVGSGVTYRISTARGEATYAVPAFALSDKAGKKVTLHSYEVTSHLNDVLVGMQGMVFLSLKEDSISVEHLFSIFNVGPIAWTPDDVVMDLPQGFKAFNKPESDGARFDEVSGRGAALHGTIGPGRQDLNFRYQVPLDQESRQVFRIAMPPHVAQLRVIVEASKSMGLEVNGFPPAQRTTARDGKHVLITERQVARAEGGLREVEITITGLPTPGPGRWVAVGLSVSALVAGGAYLFRRREDEVSEDARQELREARDALLDEIVALERAHKAGDVGPKTYPRLRAALLDALANVVAMLGETRRRARGYRGPPESRDVP